MQVDSGGRRGDPAQRSDERGLSETPFRPKTTLRVQFLVNSLVIGGAERVLEALCLDLPQHDIQPMVGCLRDPGPIGHDLAAAGVPVAGQLAPARRGLGQVFRLRSFLKSQKPHLVYLLDHSNALAFGRVAARLAGIKPQVVAVHRTRRADGQPSLSRTDRALMGWTQRVVAVSDAHAAYLREQEGIAVGKVVTIHNGVAPGAFEPPLEAEAREERRQELGLPPTVPVVAIVAALRPEKNHRLLLEALVRRPAAQRPHLAVVGDGDERATLRQAVAELGLDEYVHWLGTRTDVPRVLAAVDCLALSSHPNVETFPLCVLEAMAARLPVVSTDVGSLSEMVDVGNTGLLVPPANPVAMADALAQILDRPDRGRSLGAAGAARVADRFTRARMVQRTADLLWEVSGRRH